MRITRGKELDACIRPGYIDIYVDESHRSVGKVRTRGGGRGDRSIDGRLTFRPSL